MILPVNEILKEISKESEQLRLLIEKMLSFDPQNLPTLEEFRSFKAESKRETGMINANLEESKLNENLVQSNNSLQNPIKSRGKSATYFFVDLFVLYD